MNKTLLLCFVLLLLGSCVPLRIAPTITDYKLTEGKKFKRGLPKKTTFVFADPKDEGHFYDYVNTKFGLLDYYVDVQVPFKIDDQEFFFSYYEVEIPTKTINLIPLLIDGILNQAADFEEPILDDMHTSRVGNWYIAIEVFSATEKDCLHDDSISKALVLTYLRNLKEEYLSTYNYNEVVFKN